MFMLPYDLSEPSFAAITNHSAAYFPRNCDSVSPLAVVIFHEESRKEGSMNFITLLINPAILLAVAQRLHQLSVMARRQPFAPFGATALENEATALRAHALAKSMSFGATAIVRLKSSLHCDAPCDTPKVDVSMLFEKEETNNRILLCQGIDTLVGPGMIHLRWPLC